MFQGFRIGYEVVGRAARSLSGPAPPHLRATGIVIVHRAKCGNFLEAYFMIAMKQVSLHTSNSAAVGIDQHLQNIVCTA